MGPSVLFRRCTRDKHLSTVVLGKSMRGMYSTIAPLGRASGDWLDN